MIEFERNERFVHFTPSSKVLAKLPSWGRFISCDWVIRAV